MIHRSLRRTLMFAAAIASTGAIVSPALAQYRIDNGQAHDANNRIGSGGYNSGGGPTTGGLNGNLIVTGNVGGGRSFRGALGYTDPSAFRGTLGSATFDNFTRDSVGINNVRGSATSQYNLQGVTTFQPFFGAGRTVAPPAGFVQNGVTGAYVLPQPRIVQPNDGRIDYGGATRAQIDRGALAQQTVIGGAGLSNTQFGAFDQRQQFADQYTVSEFTQLARPAARIGLLEQNDRGASIDNGVTSNPRDPNAPGNSGPDSVDAKSADAAADNRTGLNPSAGTGAANDPTRAAGSSSSGPAKPGAIQTLPMTPGAMQATPSGTAGDPTSTGQGVQTRDLRAMQNNPQYAALRGRLDAQTSAGSAQDAIEASNRRNQAVLALRAKGQPASPDAKSSADGKAANANGSGQPGGSSAEAPMPGVTPTDGLRLPRPGAAPTAEPAPTPLTAAQGPMEIKSLASGVKNAELRKTLTNAEALMKAGKFTSAIDAYDRAQSIASDDPLVFTGRGIAELGGGYYRNAETHFRQAFTADRSLLLARFDLREMLSADRLNFLLDDLGRVANADKSDPGPLVLLAFVYYNTNLPDRAAKALDLAEQRAGGKDDVAKLMRETWTLPADKPADATDNK